jgi:hypothetical protein
VRERERERGVCVCVRARARTVSSNSRYGHCTALIVTAPAAEFNLVSACSETSLRAPCDVSLAADTNRSILKQAQNTGSDRPHGL